MNLPEIRFQAPILSHQSGHKRNLSRLRAAGLAVLTSCLFVASSISGSDHSDAPLAGTMPRQDANLTDLHAFRTAHDTLIISLCFDPSIPPSASSYVFAEDITYEINIDTDSPVSSEDPLYMGGTILQPKKIKEDVSIRIRFKAGDPDVHLHAHAKLKKRVELLNFFAGLRDDPFIRGPRQGRNVAAIVVELPLEGLVNRQDTLLIWATSKVKDLDGPFQELAGRSLRSMFPENDAMNDMPPHQVDHRLDVVADVMIYDTSRPAAYPNGRALQDDVVDLVGDPRVLGNDAPFPSGNDRPFLDEFPYLALPHDPR